MQIAIRNKSYEIRYRSTSVDGKNCGLLVRAVIECHFEPHNVLPALNIRANELAAKMSCLALSNVN